jgi:TonB-dependent starch-binding outer membrane protein SusC
MKQSRVGIGAMVAAGFLCFVSYGQDSPGVSAPTEKPQASPSESIPANLTPAQLDSLTAELEGTSTHKAAAKTPEQGAVKPAIKPAPSQDTARPAQAKEAAGTAPKTDSVVEKSEISETPAAPVTPAATAPVIVKKTPVPDTVSASAQGANSEKVMELEKDVVVGYGTMKKEDLTGSVVSVKSGDLARDAVFSVRKALQGRAAGVTVTQNSGAPGKGITVRIRGVGTINNSDPLYIVDGVSSNNIDYLNPNDIESISILKDASATAIYGSRGANGVVMVTTKKAKSGEDRVSYDMSIGTQQPWRKPSMCNAEQWAILNNEAQRAANLPTSSQLDNPSSLGTGTDWWDLVTNDNALIQQQYVSVMRGTDKLKYFLSAGYFDQQGIIRGSELHKLTFRFNSEDQVAPWFTLGNSLGVARFKTNWANESDEWNSLLVNTLAMDPVTRPRDSAGNLLPSVFSNVKNPVGIMENTNITTQKTVISGALNAALDVFDLLKVNSKLGLDLAFNDSSGFYPHYYISANDQNTLATVTRKTGTDNTVDFENTMTYERTIADDHSIKLLAGAALMDREYDSVFAEGYETPSNDTGQRYLDATNPANQNRLKGNGNGNALASTFGRVEYNYANRYLLTTTYRIDGSSKLAPGNRWDNFPSVAGAWKISQEPFMKNVPVVEGLKLRLGWGKTGNQEIPPFLYTTTTSGNQNYVFGIPQTIYQGTTYLTSGNDQIHWETQIASNAGLDFTAFHGKIEFLSDFYVKRTEDMLVQPPIPLITGYQTSPMVNGGSMENKGVELVLTYKEAIGSFLSNLGVNFSTYANKVLSLGSSDTAFIADADFMHSGMVTRTQVGHPIASFYGYKTNGIFQNQDEIRSFTYVDKDGKTQLVQPNAVPGDIRYRDDNHDGVPDQGFIGSPHPAFTMGLSADAAYRGFDLSMTWQGVFGNKIFNGTRWYTENGAGLYNLDTRMLDRWTGAGSTNDVNLPRMSVNDANNRLISDRYIEDGSYVRLKTLQLGYTFDEPLSRRLRIKQCRVYIGMENLFTFTHYTGLEPEIGLGEARGNTKNGSLTMGVDRTTYPQAKTYMLGLSLTL